MFEPGSSFSSVINERTAHALGQRIQAVYPTFDLRTFLQMIQLKDLKIGDRIRIVAQALEMHLPRDFKQSAAILIDSLPPAIPEELAGKTFADHFIVLAMGEYIARHGLEAQHFDLAMRALKAMTISFSSESAIRPFLEKFPEKTLAYLLKCTQDENVHVRRWASEGSRPRLPLARPLRSFIADPRPIFPILEALRDDPHLYVRRSVANSLNDIAKDQPDLLVKLLKQWKKEADAHRLWVMRHGLRTLAKRAHPGALLLLGYEPTKVAISAFTCSKRVKIGSDLVFSFVLKNKGKAAAVLVDYVLVFKKKLGESEKVFKLSKLRLDAGEELIVKGKRKLDHFSTRTMYPGQHRLILQINGERMNSWDFMVVD